jgi:hypothetical protein
MLLSWVWPNIEELNLKKNVAVRDKPRNLSQRSNGIRGCCLWNDFLSNLKALEKLDWKISGRYPGSTLLVKTSKTEIRTKEAHPKGHPSASSLVGPI